MKLIRTAIVVGTGLLVSLNLLQAQDQSAPPDSIVQLTADAQGLTPVAPDQAPVIGTYWLVDSNGIPVPLPCSPGDTNMPSYSITADSVLVDGTGGQVALRGHPTTLAATNAAVTAALELTASNVVNLINTVQDYEAQSDFSAQMSVMAFAAGMDAPLSPGGDSGGGTNSDGQFSSDFTVDYGTNLWIAQTQVTNGWLAAIGSNTVADVVYEIQSQTNLMQQSDWQSEGFITGSEGTNWTPFSVAQNGRTNLFIRLRSWIDSDNVGIPDWWQLEYFGYVGIDPNAPAPAGDGYTNLQKYELGLNPNVFTPPPVNNFIAVLSTNGTNVILSWTPGFGAVQHYAVSRYDFDWVSYNYDFTPLGLTASNTVTFVDSTDTNVTGGDYIDTYYQVQAVYNSYTTQGATAWIQTSPAPPQGFAVTYNSNSNSVTLTWLPSPGAVRGYTVLRQDSPTSGFSAIATVPASQTSYTDNSYPGGNGVEYEVETDYDEDDSPPSGEENPRVASEYTVPAYIVRGTNGALFLTVAGIPSGVTSIRVYRLNTQQSFYPISSHFDSDNGLTNSIYSELEQRLFNPAIGNGSFDVPVTSLVNGVYKLTTSQAAPFGTYQFLIQALGADGLAGQIITNSCATGDTNRTDYNVPFYDGRAQIAQNINFLLRETQTNTPFSILAAGDTYPNFIYSSDPSYVFAGFHFCNKNDANPLVLNEFQPFEENNYYKNFCYSPTNVDSSGHLITGIDDTESSGPPWQWPFMARSVTSNYFDTYGYVSGSASPSFSSALDGSTAQWQLFAANPGLVAEVFGENYYIPAVRNAYGLWLDSIKWPGWGTPPSFPTASPGTTLTNTDGAWFFQYDQPILSSNSYYFARHHVDLLPGEFGFSVTNTTPVIFTSVGQPFNITAWAKQSLLNGYGEAFAYAEQYFDKAYLADADGNITTNQTGILSEYGEFFPTQPGTVFLTTKPDGALGTVGQCKLNVIGLNVDANHDGTMDLGFGGQDQTLPSKPYVFWANNNFDRWHEVDGNDSEQDDLEVVYGYGSSGRYPIPDCNYTNGGNRMIPCVRDLEDFTRLWVSGIDSNALTALPAGSTVTLAWNNVSDGNPTIDLFAAADSDGGTGYLTNSTIAAQQTNITQCPYISRLAPGGSIQLNASQFTNGWAGNHFIWCGVDSGSGQLTLMVQDANGNLLGQASVYIQIKDIKQMYERWSIGDNGDIPPLTIATNVNDGVVPIFQYGPATTNTPYILHVHGWNMFSWEKDRYAETEFKRLYWQGYEGRFGEFRWPTYAAFPLNEFSSQAVNPRNFDNSEYNAWLSGIGLLNKLIDLNAKYPGKVYLTAHSMGNVVAGEALRLAGNNQVVNTYIAMQAALSAHVYDPNTVARSFSPSTPDDYASYWTNSTCYFNGSAGAGTYINFFNINDFALHSGTFSWDVNQNNKPDHGIAGFSIPYPGYYYSVTTQHPNGYFALLGSGSTAYQNFSFPGDTYTIFAYCDQSRSYALGAQAGVGGAFGGNQVNLSTVWPFDVGNYSTHRWHSAEFRSDNTQRMIFWSEVLHQMGLK